MAISGVTLSRSQSCVVERFFFCMWLEQRSEFSYPVELPRCDEFENQCGTPKVAEKVVSMGQRCGRLELGQTCLAIGVFRMSQTILLGCFQPSTPSTMRECTSEWGCDFFAPDFGVSFAGSSFWTPRNARSQILDRFLRTMRYFMQTSYNIIGRKNGANIWIACGHFISRQTFFHNSTVPECRMCVPRRGNTSTSTAQSWRFDPDAILPRASEGTLVGPGKDTHGATPVHPLWEGCGWLDRTAR